MPYIDAIRFTFYADKEALNLAAVAGEIDFQGRHINMSSYPVLKENEEVQIIVLLHGQLLEDQMQ